MSLLSTSTAIAIGLSIVLFWFINSLSKAIQLQLPGPWLAKLSPLWRVWFVLHGNSHEGYRELHQKYGRIVQTAPNVVVISDPAAIPVIYNIDTKFLKNDFYRAWVPWYKGELLETLFSVRDPAQHRKLRRPVAQKYSMTSIRSLEYLVDPCSKIFTDSMLDLQGEVVDLGAWMQWYAFDVIGEITFNKRFGFMEQRKDVYGIIAGIESSVKLNSILGQVPRLHKFLLGSLAVSDFITWVTKGAGNPMPIIDKMIEDATKDGETEDKADRADFLSHLRRLQARENLELSEIDIMAHIGGNLLAGSDTTAISLRAVFYYLMKNKLAYQKLQEEIDQADAAGNLSAVITYSECLDLKYLQACIKEAMRLHPGVQYPLERRVPSGGVQLCDTTLPEGTIVGMNPAVVHRNTEIFGISADEFEPERWLNNNTEVVKIMDRNLLTFGAGVRTCIGKNISIMEMGKLVPQVLRMFDLEWASSEPEWRIYNYWFARQTGVYVRMRPRHKL